MLTPALKQRVIEIDNHANKMVFEGGDEALLRSMHNIMGDLKQIIETADHSELDAFCERYPGFHRCMKFLESLASGLADGSLPVPHSKETQEQINRKSKKKYALKQEWVPHYEHIRKILRDLHSKFMVCLTPEGVERCARRLEIAANGALLLNTEHEMNVFLDYCLFQCYQDNSNVIQKGLKQYQSNDEESISIFKAMANGYFAYLQILEAVGNEGLVVFDLERQTEHLMIDKGLSQVAKINAHYTLVTHVVDFGDFIITTGASIPINFETIEGAQVQRRHEQFIKKLASGTVELKDRRQYITDLYKICLHEDITGTVSSPPLAFGEEALKVLINSSDIMH
jgi:hypothetical protein